MRVYTDLRCLQDENYARRGVGFHSAGLLRHIKTHLPQADVVGIIDENLPKLADDLKALVDSVQTCRYPRPNSEPDVFVELSPMTHDPTPFGPMLKRARVVSATVVYDFIPLHARQRYLPNTTAYRSYLNQMAWLKLYDVFCPISEWAANDLTKELGISADRICVAGAGVRDAFLQGADVEDPAAFRLPFPSQKYYLFVGGGDARKNADAAINAHAQVSQRVKDAPGLVVVGNYDAAMRDRLKALAAEKSGGRCQPVFLHGMDDDHLAALYRHALVTLCPSQMEGFSLPIVESIGCGTPVFAANNSAQAELVQQPEALFDADDHGRLAYLMEKICREPMAREDLIAQQADVALRFSEERVATRFWNAIREAWDRRRAGCRRTNSKPRLAILSPFPPDRSGVADYTARSIDSLAKHAEIDVYTEVENPTPHPGVKRFMPLNRYPYLAEDYDQILSVSGNSHFHIKILQYHREFGGALLQHDNRLAELYSWWRGPDAFAQMAAKTLKRAVTVADVHNWFANPNLLPSMFLDEVVANADPLIVHSRLTQKFVKSDYGVDAEYLPFCSYRTFSDEEISAKHRADARKKLGLPQDRVAIISLGIVDESKGVSECVWALEQLRAWNIPADLYFVGTVDTATCNRLKELATRLSIADGVHLMEEWISDEKYRNFVLAADYAVQFRKHRFGGLSGAVMDCITAGLPTVANDDLAEAMDAPEYVYRVPDSLSPTLIAERIFEAVQNAAHRTRSSVSRGEYLAEHHFDHYAKRMMQVLGIA